MGRRAIGGRLGRGAFHRLHRGVYAVGHRPLTMRAHWLAAVLACGEGAVLSHRSAAQLWGIRRHSELVVAGAVPRVESSSPRTLRNRVATHLTRLRSDETDVIDSIPVTSVSRTLFDLAAIVERDQLERAIEQARVLGLTDRVSLPDLIERHPGRRGSGVLREILGGAIAAAGVTRNDFEERFAALVRREGLPRPTLNAPLQVAGRIFEIDCLWRGHRLALELDGRAAHSTPMAFEADRERDRLLLADGWRVTRVTWRQLEEQPGRIAAEIRTLLGE